MMPSTKLIIQLIVFVFNCLFVCRQSATSLFLAAAESDKVDTLSNEELTKQDTYTSDATSWEYEPRLWSMDDDDIDQQDASLLDNNNYDEQENEQPLASNGFNFKTTNGESLIGQQRDFHKENYFGGKKLYEKISNFDGGIQFMLKDNNNNNNINKQEKCTQFRVDTREAVICDKKRCDKLDFEWPQFDNQLTLIQSTKDGMRFHRSDFAFNKQKNVEKNNKKKKKKQEEKESFAYPSYTQRERVKFDILDLFKPKPTSTSTVAPSTTTIQPTTTSASSNNSSTCDKEQQASELSTQSTTTTEAPKSDACEHYDKKNDDDNTNKQADNNSTQLITTLRLDTKRRKQKMLGFGGALSDSTCRNIKSLSTDMAKSLMEDYFGDRGLRYNIARMSMGSSDFSTNPYTNNDKPTMNNRISNREQQQQQQRQQQQNSVDDGDDVEMNNFRLTDEDYEFKLPIARQAIATSRQEVKFFSSLWSPPIWMKNNTNIVHGYLKGDVFGPYYKALAELMVKWLEAYKRNGIEFWASTGLNEPVTGIKPFIFHNSLGMTRDDYVTFIKIHLGPLLKQRGFESLKLLLLDDNKGYAPNWVKAALDDKEAAKYISGVAFHWYMNDEYENLNFISKHYPDKFIIHTEACNGYLPFQVHALPGNWDRGIAYMLDIIKLIQKNAVGWVDWNMALDLTGGPSWINNNLDAAVIVNAKLNEYYKSPMFYAMGHFSHFVERNSTRLDYRLANARYDYPVDAVAFHTPKDYIVIVVLNANKHQVPFKIIVDKQLVRIVTLRANSLNTIMFKWKVDDNIVL